MSADADSRVTRVRVLVSNEYGDEREVFVSALSAEEVNNNIKSVHGGVIAVKELIGILADRVALLEIVSNCCGAEDPGWAVSTKGTMRGLCDRPRGHGQGHSFKQIKIHGSDS